MNTWLRWSIHNPKFQIFNPKIPIKTKLNDQNQCFRGIIIKSSVIKILFSHSASSDE